MAEMYKVGPSLDEAEVRGRLLLGEEGESDSVSLTLGTPPLSHPLTFQVNTSGKNVLRKHCLVLCPSYDVQSQISTSENGIQYNIKVEQCHFGCLKLFHQ